MTPTPSRRRSGAIAEIGVALGYLVVALALSHRVLGDLTGRALGAVSSDSSLFSWWLGWTWYALTHAHDPLVTTWQNAPDGVNGPWNTGVPLLGALLGPVTATAGPIVAVNVATILGPAASAYAAHRALAVLVGPRWIRALAGLLYGFGPFVVAHAWVGHVNLVWSVFPPVVLWAVVRLVVQPRHHPGRAGALLGLAVVGQIGLYTQTVALGAVVLLVAVLVLAVALPWSVPARVGPTLRAAGAAVVVIAVLAAWPVWLLLRGPVRPRGPIRDADAVGADLANVVVPSPLTAIRPGTDGLATSMNAYPGEQGSYLGVAMLLVVLAAVVLVRSRAVVLTALITALVGVLSLGTSVTVLGRVHEVWLPWRLVAAVPLVGQAEAGRLAPFVALGVVTVWALAVEHLARRGGLRWVAVAAVLAAGVTWAPGDDQVTTAAGAPAFFVAGAPGLGPDAPVVEMVPRPSQEWQGGGDALRWQAIAGFTFRQTGGYFIGSTATEPVVHEGAVGAFQRGIADGGRGDVAAARADLAARGVTAVVVVPSALPDPASALRWAQAVAGNDGREQDGVRIVPLCPGGRCGA